VGWAAQLAYETNGLDKVRRILTSAKGFIAARDGVSILAYAGTEPVSLEGPTRPETIRRPDLLS